MDRLKKTIAMFLAIFMFSFFLFNTLAYDVQASSMAAGGDIIAQYFNEVFDRLCYDYGYIMDNDKRVNARDMIKEISDGGDYLYQSYIDSYNNIVNGAISSGSLYCDSATGNIKISDATYKQLGNWLTEYLDEYFAQETNLPDVVWMPVIPSDEFSASHFYSTEQYYMFRSYADNKGLTYVCAYPKTDYFKVYDFSNYTFFMFTSDTTSTRSQFLSKLKSANILCSDLYASNNETWSVLVASSGGVDLDHQSIIGSVYDASGLVSDDLTRQQLSYNWDDSFELYIYPRANGGLPTRYWSRSCTDSQGFFVCSSSMDARYIPIFFSVESIKKFATGQSDYYRVNPTYDGGDVTINPNADYSKVYNNITTTIQNNYNDGKDYSDILAAIQIAYAESMKEISAGLDDIGDNTEEANSWLEQIKKNTDALLDPDGGSWLARIYEQETAIKDSIDKGFADLLGILSIDDIDDPGGTGGGTGGGDDSGGGGSSKTFWNKLGDFASGVVTVILDLISTVVFKALDGLDYLLGILMDNIGLVFTEMALVFGRLNNAMIVGNGFYASIYGHLPEVARDMIAYLTFCFVCAAVIRTLKG